MAGKTKGYREARGGRTNIRLPTTILPMQCPQGHRRDCSNRRTCMFRHIDERVGDPIEKAVEETMARVKLSPMKKAKVAIDRAEREKKQERRGEETPYNVTGLRNVDGTSCYINAVIQGLTSLHPFTQKLIAMQPAREQRLTEHIQKTVIEITSGVERFISPIRMVEEIRRESQGRFGNGRGQEYAEHYRIQYWRPGLTDFIDYHDNLGRKVR